MYISGFYEKTSIFALENKFFFWKYTKNMRFLSIFMKNKGFRPVNGPFFAKKLGKWPILTISGPKWGEIGQNSKILAKRFYNPTRSLSWPKMGFIAITGFKQMVRINAFFSIYGPNPSLLMKVSKNRLFFVYFRKNWYIPRKNACFLVETTNIQMGFFESWNLY